jgi:hypothetical protein
LHQPALHRLFTKIEVPSSTPRGQRHVGGVRLLDASLQRTWILGDTSAADVTIGAGRILVRLFKMVPPRPLFDVCYPRW